MGEAAAIEVRRDAGDNLIVRLGGKWSLRGGLPSTKVVEEAMAASPPPRVIGFETDGLESWDSAAVTIVERIATLSEGRGIEIRRDGLPEGMRQLLALASAVPAKADARAAADSRTFVARVGDAAVGLVDGLRDALRFVGEATLSFGRLLRGKANFRTRDLALVVQETGAQGLPIVTLINFLVGLIIAFVGAIQLEKFGAGIYIADLVAIVTVREMGCIMTGIIVSGRTGSGFAAQLGTMKVNQEIEALGTMGVPPMDFLVLPRMLALAMMMPLLTFYADVVGILGGAMVAIGMLGQTATQYWVQTKHAIGLTDIGLGIGKSLIFGILIAIAGCMRGMNAGKDAAAVGQAATSAVVLAIVWIIVTDGIFALLTNILGI